jgi:polyisoprenoid-binding protein YceI
VEAIGSGNDPWGGYRSGFEGKTRFAMADFGIVKNLGPKSKDVEMILSVEGIRQ